MTEPSRADLERGLVRAAATAALAELGVYSGYAELLVPAMEELLHYDAATGRVIVADSGDPIEVLAREVRDEHPRLFRPLR